MKIRNFFGYLLGVCIFLILFPYIMYFISEFGAFAIFDSGFVSNLISVPFIIFGIVFMIWSNLYMAKIGQGNPADGFNVSIGERTKKLMIAGPYKYSRNPMLFGTFVFYVGFAFVLNSITSFIFLVIFLLLMICYVSKFEEPRLQKDFGVEYAKYKKSVSRIIPLKFKK